MNAKAVSPSREASSVERNRFSFVFDELKKTRLTSVDESRPLLEVDRASLEPAGEESLIERDLFSVLGGGSWRSSFSQAAKESERVVCGGRGGGGREGPTSASNGEKTAKNVQ